MIVGIDPGTTIGFACVDLKGKVISAFSKRGIDKDSLLSEVLTKGRVLVVGCDKAKVPSLVHSIAAKVGAKIISPSYDLLVCEKRKLADGLNFENSHEMDAIASAIFAYNKILPLLRRIEKTLENEKKLSLFDKVVGLVLKENMSIRAALIVCDNTPKNMEEKKVDVEERDSDVVRLFSALSRERRSFAQLKEKNERLEVEIKKLREIVGFLKEKERFLVRPKSHDALLREKNSSLQSLSDKFLNLKTQLEVAKKDINFLEDSLLRKDKVALPVLSRLSWDSALRARPFVSDAIFLESVDSLSQRAVELLSSCGLRIVFCKNLPSEKLRRSLPFIFRNFKGDIFGRVALVDFSFLDAVRMEKEALEKVIDEFKKERES